MAKQVALEANPNQGGFVMDEGAGMPGDCGVMAGGGAGGYDTFCNDGAHAAFNAAHGRAGGTDDPATLGEVVASTPTAAEGAEAPPISGAADY